VFTSENSEARLRLKAKSTNMPSIAQTEEATIPHLNGKKRRRDDGGIEVPMKISR
jgi:hypothetical protein